MTYLDEVVPMNACPTSQDIVLSLHGKLESSRSTAIETHVESCNPCRQFVDTHQAECPACRENLGLDASSAQPRAGDLGELHEAIDSHKEIPAEFLERLKQQGPAAEGPFSPTVPFDVPPGAKVKPPKRLADYELDEEIGRGGMGVVYRAIQDYPKREVALKLILPGKVTKDYVDRFQLEANAAGTLTHPNIVSVFAAGEAKGHAYLSMPLVSGAKSLKDILTLSKDGTGRQGTLEPIEAARLLKTIADAMEYVHGKGIIHRDLKPGNILIDDKLQPHVTDFGLAKRVGTNEKADGASSQGEFPTARGARSLTAPGVIPGTPCYMSPEQVARLTLDRRSDVYTLGVILYELLIGKVPFRGKNHAETFKLIQTAPPEPLRTKGRWIPKDLDAICLKCLRKEPDNRYQSAAELGKDLQRFLEGKPVNARPVGKLVRFGKMCRRYKARTAASVLALVVLLTFAIGGPMVAARETALRAQEEQQRGLAERRFEDVRELAHSFLFDFEQRVAPLPGSTPVRQFVVDQARIYLSRLASESPENPDLLHGLAVGYAKLGDILGHPFHANLNDGKGALVAYQESLKWAEAHVRMMPNNVVAHRDLMIAHNKLGDMQRSLGRPAQSAEHYRRSDRILADLLLRLPNDPQLLHDRVVTLQRQAEILLDQGDTELALKTAKDTVSGHRVLDRQLGTVQSKRDLAVALQALGDIQVQAGLSSDAVKSFEEAEAILEDLNSDGVVNAPLERDRMVLNNRMGDLLFRTNRTSEALQRYQRGLQSSRYLAGIDPHNSEAQHDLALSHERIGDILEIEHQLTDALEHFVAARTIRRAMADANPTLNVHQRTLSVALENCGDVLIRLAGRADEAETNYRESLIIRQALVDSDPESREAMHDLALSHIKLGRFQMDCGQTAAALESFANALKIRRRLFDKDPQNLLDKHKLVLGLQYYGDILLRMNHSEEAIAYYHQSRDHAQALVAADPANSDYKEVLAISLELIGSVQNRTGQFDDALATALELLKIREDLATANPNAHNRSNLAIGHEHVGNALLRLNRVKDALDHHGKSLTISQQLAQQSPGDLDAQRSLALAYQKVGTALRHVSKEDEALSSFQESQSILEELVRRAPKNTQFQHDLGVVLERLADQHAEAAREDAAVACYDRMIELRQAITHNDPQDAEAHKNLAIAYHGRGYIETVFGDDPSRSTADRIQDWREAVAWNRKTLEVLDAWRENGLPALDAAFEAKIRVYIANCERNILLIDAKEHARQGELAKAVAAAEDLLAQDFNTYKLAGLYSLMSSAVSRDTELAELERIWFAEVYAARAVELLRQFVEKGFRGLEHMIKDEDLAPLRSREDFGRVAAEIEKRQAAEKVSAAETAAKQE
jgi:non-specific serine/threonine protein kinase/serine/threonine-protein kinase